MKAVVFGGAGFIGSHVADALTFKGHDVVIFDCVSSPYLQENQRMVVGDILDEQLVAQSIEGCDVVYHLAGIADIDEAAQKPYETIKSNILGTANILEAARQHHIKRFVFASSLYVYSKAGSFYRTSKQSCELLIQNYQESFGLNYTILRYGSLYGPRGHKSAIHTFVKEALQHKKIVRHGDGEDVREYIHVLDAAKDSVTILDDEFINQHVLLTGHHQIKIKDLLVMISEMLEDDIELVYEPSSENYHYEITPYNFAPKIGKRLMSKTYLDLGQGVLDTIHRVAQEIEEENRVSR